MAFITLVGEVLFFVTSEFEGKEIKIINNIVLTLCFVINRA